MFLQKNSRNFIRFLYVELIAPQCQWNRFKESAIREEPLHIEDINDLEKIDGNS